MMEAAIFISVFVENSTSYDIAMSQFLTQVPAYIYLTSDGSYPAAPAGTAWTTTKLISYWNGLSTFNTSGVAQETCRDLEHTGYGIASISHVAEISRIQGRDFSRKTPGRG